MEIQRVTLQIGNGELRIVVRRVDGDGNFGEGQKKRASVPAKRYRTDWVSNVIRIFYSCVVSLPDEHLDGDALVDLVFVFRESRLRLDAGYDV